MVKPGAAENYIREPLNLRDTFTIVSTARIRIISNPGCAAVKVDDRRRPAENLEVDRITIASGKVRQQQRSARDPGQSAAVTTSCPRENQA